MHITEVNYPFKSLIEEIPNAIELGITSALAHKNDRAMVAFYTLKKHSQKEFQLVGSGFIAVIPDYGFCIITASHVITQIAKEDFRVIIVDGEKYKLEHVEALHHAGKDYAVIEIPVQMRESTKSFAYLNLTPRPELTPLKSFMILGYPSSKNTYHPDREWKGFQRLNLVFHEFKYNTENEDIFFPYDSRPGKKGTKMTIEPGSKFESVPSLAGMSGCVVAQIMINLETDSLSIRPIGIFKEHLSKKDKYLVGCTFTFFADEINNLLSN